MDIISTYQQVGSYRGTAAICGTTPKTVKRVVARAEAGGTASPRVPRVRNYEPVAGLVTAKVASTKGRISAKRLLPAARAAGFTGSARSFRRLVAGAKVEWRREDHRGRRPAVDDLRLPGGHVALVHRLHGDGGSQQRACHRYSEGNPDGDAAQTRREDRRQGEQTRSAQRGAFHEAQRQAGRETHAQTDAEGTPPPQEHPCCGKSHGATKK